MTCPFTAGRDLLPSIFVAFLLLGGAVGAVAQDEEGDYDNWKEMDVPPAPARSPGEEKETFRVAPGFDIELAAAEPRVVDPIVLRWGPSGRMWVVEMRGYMPNVSGKGEQKPVGTIAVLEDTNEDGRYDERTTFLDGLVMPRGVALVEGGVLVAEPPHLWYCRDTDGDLRSDEKTDLTKYARQGPVEHTENGLRRAIDNWIYNAKSNRRFRFTLEDGKPVLKEEKTRFRGQWGISQDSYGRLYYNTNSYFLKGETFPRNLEKHDGNLLMKDTTSAGLVASNPIYSIRVNPGINRGYREGMLRPDGRLARATGVSGQAIYRGEQFPKSYREDAFVPDVAGNIVAFFSIRHSDGGMKALRRTYKDPNWGKRDFLASRDERFRPVNVENGPDGTLYVVDMYRGIIQHANHVTERYLKKQILARNLDKPLGLGRIWRIYSTERDYVGSVPDLTEYASGKLVDLLSHPNGWHRDWAQRLLIRREPNENVVKQIRDLAREERGHLDRIHALWVLEGLEELDEKTVQSALESPSRQVRVAAARARSSDG